MNVREHIEGKIVQALEEYQRIVGFLTKLPADLGELEVDHVYLIGNSWLSIGDSSHKDLGAKLATITDQTTVFVTWGSTRTASFKDVGPFYQVDLDRPNPKCRKVRVLKPARELEIEICGDLPEGYELLEELE